MRILIFALLSLLIFYFCSGQTSKYKKSPINGTWIELNNKSDTIVFLPEYDGINPIFQLKRGYDINERGKIPKLFSGPYWYKFETNAISISWFLSSDSRYNQYYFSLSENKQSFKISNFYQGNDKFTDTLTFLRIK